MTFENVHTPVIDRETWEQVQQKRGKVSNTRKPSNGERNMFSGLLVCSTCGANLNFHFNQGNHEITYFNCSNYNNRGKQREQCDATHYIRTDFLEQVVLSDITRITAFAKHYENEFIGILTESEMQEQERQNKSAERELACLLARIAELDVLFERIYEDSVSGKISKERFAKMSRKYEDEQAKIKQKIVPLQKEVSAKARKSGTAKEFLEIVKRYTRIKKLTSQILHEFVEKIVVHHRQRIDGVDVQKIEIIYNCVGTLDIRDLKKIPQSEILLQTRKGVALCPESKTATPNPLKTA